MKKLSFTLSVLGVLIMCSCQQDEIKENVSESLENELSAVELVATNPSKNFDFTIGPGLYGATQTNALKNVSYTYVGHPSALANIPKSKRKYRIYFQVKNPAKPDVEWDPQASFEIPSSTVTVKFPKFGNTTYAKWRIIYQMYHKNHPYTLSYSFRKKVKVKN